MEATVFFGGNERRVTDLYEEAIGFLQISGDEPRRAAKSRFETIVDMAPSFAEGHFQFARIVFEEGDTEKALKHAADAATLFTSAAAYRVLHVTCLAVLGRFDEAALAVKSSARDIASLSDSESDRIDGAEATVTEFLRRHIALIFAQYAFVGGRLRDTSALLDDALSDLGSKEEPTIRQGEAALRALVDQFSTHAEARFYLAEHLRRNGRWKEALTLCEEAEAGHSLDWPLQIEFGVLLAHLDQTQRAISHFEEAALINQQLPIYSTQHLSGTEGKVLADWYHALLEGVTIRPGAYQLAWKIPPAPRIGHTIIHDRRRFSTLLRIAGTDIIDSIWLPRAWWTLARNDVSSRYRRTLLGPWWIVMGTGIALLGMGVVWSTLFRMDIKRFFPYLSSGYVIWMFFSSVLTESCNAFADGHAQSIQKNIDIPRFVHVLRLMARNVLLFFHAFSIVVVGIAVFRVTLTPATLLAIPGFVLATLTLLPVALIFALIGTRYRDFGPAVGAMLTVIFFVTPVMWQTEQLGDKVYLAQMNPFTHLVAIIRDPLLGTAPPFSAWIIVVALCAMLWPIALALFARTRHRIVYWL